MLAQHVSIGKFLWSGEGLRYLHIHVGTEIHAEDNLIVGAALAEVLVNARCGKREKREKHKDCAESEY